MIRLEIPEDLEIPELSVADKERADNVHAEALEADRLEAEYVRATGSKGLSYEEGWRLLHPGQPYPGEPVIGPTLAVLRRLPPEQRALYLYVMTRHD